MMLHAMGFPDDKMPELLVHGWWNLAGAKMSKSVGNIIDPFVLIDKYGSDALRYYLMDGIGTGTDADFSEERLIATYNARLANSLGNLLNRTLNMINRYRNGVIKHGHPLTIKKSDGREYSSFIDASDAPGGIGHYTKFMCDYGVNVALNDIAFMCRSNNEFLEQTAPWNLATNDSSKWDVETVLYVALESLRIIAILISPVLPHAAHRIFDQLNWKMEPELSGKEERFSLADAEWGRLPDGHVVGKPVPLFPRIEIVN